MSSFPDIPAGAWYGQAVQIASALGLMGGFPDGTFRPDEPFTRAQAASVISRLALNDLALRRWASQRLRSQAAPAVVHISTGNSVGAGVVVHPDGWVVTCHHVIAGATGEIKVKFPDGDLTRGDVLEVVVEAPEVDLALCRLGMHHYWGPYPYLHLADTVPEPAEPVVMLGSPAGISGWESHGLIARPEVVGQTYEMPQELVCISGAVNPGNSGGALVRATDGTLLGIVDAKLVSPYEGMAFAVPAAQVAGLLKRAGVIA